jgi:hypothetical protein
MRSRASAILDVPAMFSPNRITHGLHHIYADSAFSIAEIPVQ